MKKAFLLLIAAGSLATATSAQSVLNLNGSSYFQSFDNVGNGLPAGWEIDSNATATTKGTPLLFNTTPIAWKQPVTTSGKGLNFAAKNGFTDPGTTTAIQAAATNRAMGLRQVGNIDSQIAFTVTIAQTAGLSNFNMSFLLQSLDTSSPRVSTWEVQYGVGANPASFTTVAATGTLTTGGSGNFSSNLITASFGTALNNVTGPVVIRIATLHKSVGSGNRASTAVDSLTLSWTGTAVNNQPQVVSLSPANGAANVATTANLVITFDKNITAGTGNIYLKDATTQAITTKAANSPDVTIAGMTATITNLGLQQGRTYRVTFDSTAFKNGIYNSAGIYDSTSWVFMTQNPLVTVSSIYETFDAACAAGNLPTGWSRQNVTGPAQQWHCITSGNNSAMQMNGFVGGSQNVNEDWLITPKINLNGSNAGRLIFKMFKRFSGPELEVLTSQNYDGSSAPASATWTALSIPMSIVDTGFAYKTYSKTLGAAGSTPFYIAFKYTSTATASYDIRIDSVVVNNSLSVSSIGSTANTLSVSVIGAAANGHVLISFDAANSGAMQAAIYDLAGRNVYTQQLNAVKGVNRTFLTPESLQSGLYIIRLGNGIEQGIARTFIQ